MSKGTTVAYIKDMVEAGNAFALAESTEAPTTTKLVN